jgi:hypothetical protein
MDYREKFDAKIRECLVALDDRIAEFKASGQVADALVIEKQCNKVRKGLDGKC